MANIETVHAKRLVVGDRIVVPGHEPGKVEITSIEPRGDLVLIRGECLDTLVHAKTEFLRVKP